MMRPNEKALVVAVHPQDHSVDLVLFESGTRFSGVQVLSPTASSNTGLNDLAVPDTATGDSRWSLTQAAGRQVHAIVGFVGETPYVQGFLFPQVCQMTFAEQNRKIDRHASDFYQTIDGSANAEWYHPSGTYLRIGETPAHEDLTGKDFDKKWKIANNTGTAPHVQLVVASGGAPKCTVHIAPDGSVTITSVAGASLVFPSGMTFDTPLATFTGDIKANGQITDFKRSMQGDRDIYNVHTNPSNGTSAPPQQQ